jgi:Spy/CpxP family protein refolding chaperone
MTLAAVAVVGMLGASVASAQARPLRRVPAPEAGVTPGEVQRLFDAYAIMQAQQELQLSDEQYPRFLARMKALQTARQRGLVDRNRVLQEMRRLINAPQLDETQSKTQLKALADIDARVVAEVRDAQVGIDQVLDVRQQLRFRLFEEQMERRKVELLLRARQANRPRNAPPAPQR